MANIQTVDVIYITYPIDTSEYPILADSVRLFIEAFLKTYPSSEFNTTDVVVDLLTDSQHLMLMVTIGDIDFSWSLDKEPILRSNMADIGSSSEIVRDITKQNIFFYKNIYPGYFGQKGHCSLYRVKLPDTSELKSVPESNASGYSRSCTAVEKTAICDYVKAGLSNVLTSINVSGRFNANSKEPLNNMDSLSDALNRYAMENTVLISVDLAGNFMVNVLVRDQSNVELSMISDAIDDCNVSDNRLMWTNDTPVQMYHRFLAAMFMGSKFKRYPSEYCRILDPTSQVFADNVIAAMSPVNPAFVYVKQQANDM